MEDGPTSDAHVSMVFITCAICKSGTDAGKSYGCIRWGHEFSNGQWKPLPLILYSRPPSDWIGAVIGWKKQTAGQCKCKNDPKQQDFPYDFWK
jgi:hypothetical protein